MPKFYCEYCDLYLTHSGLSGRRQHLTGRRHINNKIEYYQLLIKEKGLTPPIYPPPPGMCLPAPSLGKAGLPGLPGMLGAGLPRLPGMPMLPGLGALGARPGLPALPGMLPRLPAMPGALPRLPGM
eukprot:TRINITY_DN36968_c0_g1_i1.p2 TRINITY_DN36968_c0_g1~~TRINITY_DN36968_c0_g1_i1.p2  ORF type:complete len:126 (-),score=10.50 TRINITY_DN36968_c0_g1_i1:72-449(-)